MIQPLRTYHRRTFLALAVLLPIIFVAGLAARRESPTTRVSTRTAFLVAGTDWRNHSFVLQLSFDPAGRKSARILATKPGMAPDVLVYLADAAPEGGQLPATARLLGKYDFQTSYPVPAPGFFILYSPAHQAVLDVLPIGGKP